MKLSKHFALLHYVYKVCIITERAKILMKQRELVKKLEGIGFVLERHGGNHDIYRRGVEIEKIPRHKEINERLARAILRKWGLM